MLFFFIGVFLLISIYFLALTYLLNNTADGLEPNKLELLNNRKLPWWEKETADSLLKQIELEPDNAEARYKFCLLMPHEKILQCMENSLWLIANTDVSFNSPEMTHAFSYNPEHPMAKRAKELVLDRLAKSSRTTRQLMDTVEFLPYDNKDLKLKLINEVLEREPDNAYVVDWVAFKYELFGYDDDDKYKKQAMGLYYKRDQMPWSNSEPYQFSVLQKKYKYLVPDLIKTLLFYLSSILYPEREFDRCLRLGRLGLLVLKYGSESEQEEIAEKILPLLPESVAYCWFPPLMDRVYYFLTMLQLRRGNLEMARYYLANNTEYKVTSEYSFLSCKELIAECRALGFKQFAADFLREAASGSLSDPGIKQIISLVEKGVDPWPKFADKSESQKIEDLFDVLEFHASFDSQLKYLERLPYVFLGNYLYSAITDYYKISDWVESAKLLTYDQKKLLTDLENMLKHPSSGLDFSDTNSAQVVQQNSDWITITKLVNTILESFRAEQGGVQ